MEEGTPRSEENKNCSMIQKQILPGTPWRSSCQSKCVFPEGTETWNRISERNCSPWKKLCWNREMVWEKRISREKPLCNDCIPRTQPSCTTWWGDRGVESKGWKLRLWKGEEMMQFLCFSLWSSQLESNIFGRKKKFSEFFFLLVMVIAAEFSSCYLNSQDFSPYFHLLPSPSSSSWVGRVNEWLNGLWLLAKPN